MPRGKSNAPANETKEDAFKRLATARVVKALTAIKNVGKLASHKGNTNPEYPTKIVGALVAAVDVVEAQYQPKQKEEKAGFAL